MDAVLSKTYFCIPLGRQTYSFNKSTSQTTLERLTRPSSDYSEKISQRYFSTHSGTTSVSGPGFLRIIWQTARGWYTRPIIVVGIICMLSESERNIRKAPVTVLRGLRRTHTIFAARSTSKPQFLGLFPISDLKSPSVSHIHRGRQRIRLSPRMDNPLSTTRLTVYTAPEVPLQKLDTGTIGSCLFGKALEINFLVNCTTR